MKLVHSILKTITGSEAARLFFAFVCTFAVSIGASTTLLDGVIGQDHLVIVNYNASPIEWLALVLVMYFILRRPRCLAIPTNPTTELWIKNFAGIAGIATAVFAIFFTHPSDHSYQIIQKFLASFPLTGGPIFAALVAIVLVIPFFPAYVFADPKNAMARWRELLIIFVALLGSFSASILEALYFKAVLPFVMNVLTKIFLLFSGNVYVNIPNGVVSIDGFRVSIGPACAGFSYIFLFLMFFGYLLYELYKSKRVSMMRSMVACVIGVGAVFALNIIRIASLMLVGRVFPDFALTMFHSVVGSIYFFIFFIIYFPLVRWWISHGEKQVSPLP
jgi:exosortase/archaeosortase family protein